MIDRKLSKIRLPKGRIFSKKIDFPTQKSPVIQNFKHFWHFHPYSSKRQKILRSIKVPNMFNYDVVGCSEIGSKTQLNYQVSKKNDRENHCQQHVS